MKPFIWLLLAALPALGAGNRRVDILQEDTVIPHIAFGNSWSTTITLVNSWYASEPFELRFWSSEGLPLSVPTVKYGTTPIVRDTIPVGGAITIEILGNSQELKQGWAELSYNWANTEIGGMAVFRQRVGASADYPRGRDNEAVVPISSNSETEYMMPFDNTSGFEFGLALANVENSTNTLKMLFTDEAGQQIGDVQQVQMAGYNHTSFVLSSQYKQLAGKRGVIHFQSENGRKPIRALGLRFNVAAGFAFTSVHTLHDETDIFYR